MKELLLVISVAAASTIVWRVVLTPILARLGKRGAFVRPVKTCSSELEYERYSEELEAELDYVKEQEINNRRTGDAGHRVFSV